MFKQLGDDSSKGDRSIVPSITYVLILVFANKYNESLHAFLWNFSMHQTHMEQATEVTTHTCTSKENVFSKHAIFASCMV